MEVIKDPTLTLATILFQLVVFPSKDFLFDDQRVEKTAPAEQERHSGFLLSSFDNPQVDYPARGYDTACDINSMSMSFSGL